MKQEHVFAGERQMTAARTKKHKEDKHTGMMKEKKKKKKGRKYGVVIHQFLLDVLDA